MILDSSVIIAGRRRGDTLSSCAASYRRGRQSEAALSSVGLTELVHGIIEPFSPNTKLAVNPSFEELRIGTDSFIRTRRKPQC